RQRDVSGRLVSGLLVPAVILCAMSLVGLGLGLRSRTTFFQEQLAQASRQEEQLVVDNTLLKHQLASARDELAGMIPSHDARVSRTNASIETTEFAIRTTTEKHGSQSPQVAELLIAQAENYTTVGSVDEALVRLRQATVIAGKMAESDEK